MSSRRCRTVLVLLLAASVPKGCGRADTRPRTPATEPAAASPQATTVPPESAALVGKWDLDRDHSVAHYLRVKYAHVGMDSFLARYTGDQVPVPASAVGGSGSGPFAIAQESVGEIDTFFVELRGDGTYRERCKIGGLITIDYDVTGTWRADGRRVLRTSRQGNTFTLIRQGGRLYAFDGDCVVFSRVGP